MAAFVALEDILEEVTRSDTEDAQDSTDEETDQKTEAKAKNWGKGQLSTVSQNVMILAKILDFFN